MPIYRSKYDPYDVDRRQTYQDFQVGSVRVRVWRNETWKGSVMKFDLVHVTPRPCTDQLSRGVPLDEAHNAAAALLQLAEWEVTRHKTRAERKPLSDLDRIFLEKSNKKRRF